MIEGYVSEERELPDQTTLIKEGEFNTRAYVILDGRVRVKKNTPQGLVTVDTLGPGAIVGDMMLIDPDLPGATAMVVAQGTVRVGVVDPEKFRREMAAMPPHVRDIMRLLVRRLKEMTEKVSALAARS